jgi:mono/diheme cytochrome c family protein
MKILKIVLMSCIAVCLIVSFAFAAGDTAKGKALFNDPKFAGGTAGKSCSSCHPDGKGLEKAAEKKEFNLGGKKQKSLAEAVNMCIVNAINGKAIDPKSDQMKDLVAYIMSLKGKASAEKAKENGK